MAKYKRKKTTKKAISFKMRTNSGGKNIDTGIKTAREKMIGQHIGYRYDVNLLPDYKRLTPFLKKYIEHMGWDDLNWLEDVHMGCLLYTSPSPRDGLLSRMPSSA